MGKGDKKSKRGKIFKGSFGNSRLRKTHTAKSQAEIATESKPKPKATATTKAKAKK